MARTFANASSSRVNLALGAGAQLSTAVTLAAICKSGSDALTNPGILTVGAGAGGSRWVMFTTTGGNLISAFQGGSVLNNTATLKASEGWTFIAITKPAGTVTGRIHKYVYTTATWTHEASSGVAGDVTPATSSAIGANTDGSGAFTGDIAIAGAYAAALTDAQLESMAYDLGAWWQVNPNGLWLLDQSATTTNVNDLSGNRADQTSLTATTVGTSPVPVFSYSAPIRPATHSAATVVTTTTTTTIISTAPLRLGQRHFGLRSRGIRHR